ncbi:hypothetical protein CTAYLR_005135 [Chrysophaeum taylorii]|uniref:Dynein heavy chain linker domain-containing protein n=1 Tax=Chrysophaeum taylorii TaxID=2483200 RepID=A0AAD7UGK3_9STRA|nr:hypothetical protein CTAYLR_005135 [Chrysophaeum taylorii]
MDPKHYRSAWFAFTKWLQEAMLAPGSTRTIVVGDMGFMSHRLYALGIRVPVFALADRWKRRHDVAQEILLDSTPDMASTSHRIRCPTQALASALLPDPECAAFALESIFRSIAAMATEGISLALNFGVGTLVVHDKVARFEFSQKGIEDTKPPQTPPPKRPDDGPRSSKATPNRRSRWHIASEPRYGRYLQLSSTEVSSDDNPSSPQKSCRAVEQRQPSRAERVAAATAFERGQRDSSTPARAIVLDPHARLRAATFTHPGASASVSANVAAHYSYVDGHPPSERAPLVDFVLSPRAALYGHYLTRGIPEVEEMKPAAVSTIVTRVAGSLPFELNGWSQLLDDDDCRAVVLADRGNKEEEDDDDVLRRIVRSMRAGYCRSIKKAILDYVLLSASERVRLGLPRGTPRELALPPKLSSFSPSAKRATYYVETIPVGACRAMRKALRHRLLLTTTPFVECHRVWQDYKDVLLLKLPSTEDVINDIDVKASWKPSSIAEFERRQSECLEEVQKMIKDKWQPQLARSFFDGIEKGDIKLGKDDVGAEAYFNVAALMMGSQLNQIVRRTIDAMLAYFEEFLPEGGQTFPPAFVLVPNLKDSRGAPGISLETTASNLRASVVRVFDGVVTAFNDVDRIEHWQMRNLLRAGLEASSSSSQSTHQKTNANSHHEAIPRAIKNLDLPDLTAKHKTKALLAVNSVDDPQFADARRRILHVLDVNLETAAANMRLYQPFEFLLQTPRGDEGGLANPLMTATTTSGSSAVQNDDDDDVTHIAEIALSSVRQSTPITINGGRDVDEELEELRKTVARYTKSASDVTAMRVFEPVPLVELDVAGLHGLLGGHALEKTQRLFQAVAHGIASDVRAVTKKARAIILWLQQRPKTTRELAVARKNLDQAGSVDLVDLRDAFLKIWKKVDFLADHDGLQPKVLDAACQAQQAAREVHAQVERAADLLKSEREALKIDLAKRGEQIKAQLAEVRTKVRSFADKGNAKLIREYIDQLIEVRKVLASEISGVEAFNDEETKLGLDSTTDFPSIQLVSSELEPYEQLWTTALKFHTSYSTWIKGPIRSLDGQAVAKDHAEMVAIFTNLSKRLIDLGATEPAKFATSIAAQLDRFKPNIPIVRALASKALTEDHWAEISAVVGFQMTPGSLTNLANFLELSENRRDKSERLADIAARAEQRQQQSEDAKEQRVY